MARYVTVSSVGGSTPWYPSAVPLGPEEDTRLAEIITTHWLGQIETILPDAPDLIVLPECSTRFQQALGPLPASEVLRLYGSIHERMLAALSEVARANRCYLVYPTILPAVGKCGKYANAALVLDRTGTVCGRYDKQFITRSEQETGVIPGGRPALIECDFGRLAIAICFDLNFEEAFSVYRDAAPDLLVFPSMYHGGLMQGYRAYQCRAHLVSAMGQVNLRSEIRAPTGEVVARTSNYNRTVTATLNLDCVLVHLDHNREKLSRLKSRFGRRVRITDPGLLGAVLVTGEDGLDDIKTAIASFDIEPLDAYLHSFRSAP